LDRNNHNVIQFHLVEDRKHTGMEMGKGGVVAVVSKVFTGENLVDTISAATSGMCCGRV